MICIKLDRPSPNFNQNHAKGNFLEIDTVNVQSIVTLIFKLDKNIRFLKKGALILSLNGTAWSYWKDRALRL